MPQLGLPRFAAVVLTGGASSRMGADKALIEWEGRRAIDAIAECALQVGAVAVWTVGPTDYGYPNLAESQPGGGPAAGFTEACRQLRQAGYARALALACDAPSLLSADLDALLASASPGAAYAGLHLPLVMDLDALPAGAARGWSMARFITEARLQLVEAPAEAIGRLRGANTPAELVQLRAVERGAGN